MAPKYNHETYNLGTFYPRWSKPLQDVIDQALNMILPTSPAGQVLNGVDRGKCIFLQNAQMHVGTDNAGLDHVNFVIRTLGAGGVQTGECHLYPDGSYTPSAAANRFPGNPAGRVVPPAPAPPVVPGHDDFPPLGGGGKGHGGAGGAGGSSSTGSSGSKTGKGGAGGSSTGSSGSKTGTGGSGGSSAGSSGSKTGTGGAGGSSSTSSGSKTGTGGAGGSSTGSSGSKTGTGGAGGSGAGSSGSKTGSTGSKGGSGSKQ